MYFIFDHSLFTFSFLFKIPEAILVVIMSNEKYEIKY